MIKTGKAEISLLDNGNLCISVPIIIKLKHGRKVIIAPQSLAGKVLGGENPVNESLVLMLARGYAWMKRQDPRYTGARRENGLSPDARLANPDDGQPIPGLNRSCF